MNDSSNHLHWPLRIILLLQCTGSMAKLFWIPFVVESNIYGVLFFDRGWPEETALSVEHWGTTAYFIAGILVFLCGFFPKDRRTVLWSQVGLLVYIFLWSFLYAATKTYRGGEFMSEWILAEHAVRYLVPLGLIAILVHRLFLGETILRVATAATFFGHGLLAFRKAPHFVDLLLWSSFQLEAMVPESLAKSIHQVATQDHAEASLVVIGLIDILLAAMILVGRFRLVAAYMVFWGFITACSRMTAVGWEKYPETLIRTANYGIPVVLLLYWWYRKKKDE